MRICILTSSYPINCFDGRSTAGIFVRDFAVQLAKENHRVYIFTQMRKGQINDDPGITVERFNWFIIDKWLSTFRLFKPQELRSAFSLVYHGSRGMIRFVKKQKIDFCLAMWTLPSGYFARIVRKKLGIPYAVWALGSDIWTWGRYPIIRSLVRKILQEADYIFADGNNLAKEVSRLTGRSCEFLPSARAVSDEISEKITIEKSMTNFLYVGRWERNKGIDILIEAMRLLLADGCRARLFAIGGGGLEERIKGKIKQYHLEKYIECPGLVPPSTVTAYLKNCDCLIIPSRKESVPLIFGEAVRIGIPVIVTDVGDMGDLTRKHDLGEIVPPENPFALKEAMKRMIKSSFLLETRNTDELREMFNLKKVVKNFLNNVI